VIGFHSMKRIIAAPLLGLLALQGCSKSEPPAQPADVVLFGGKVLTADKDLSVHSALVVKDGMILAVGDDSLAKKYTAPLQIDLKGRAVAPGFNDNHYHPGSRSPRAVDAALAKSIPELQELVRAKAKELGPGEWITGYGWDEAIFPEKRNPVRGDLDVAAPDNPVVLTRAGGHSAVGNSMAIKIAGITRATKDPDRGVIERDAKGEPNGIIRERRDLYLTHVPRDNDESLRPSVIENLKKLTALGLTSVNIAGAGIVDELPPEAITPGTGRLYPSYKVLRGIYDELGEELPRATVSIAYPGPKGLAAFAHKTGDGNDRIRLGAIGEVPGVDGGFTGPTAWTTRDYKGQPGFRGRANFDEASLQVLVDDVAKNGWKLGLHAIGDAAIDMTAKVYAEALKKYPKEDHRWYLAHFTMTPSDATIELMAKTGIIGAAQPNFLYTLENRYVETLEGEVLEHNNPVGVPAKRGVFVSFGSDILPVDPRVGLYAAVTRKGRSGRVYGPDEAVSVHQAIRMHTYNTAYMNHDDQKKGSLEVGKFADMIVIDRDPMTVPHEELLTMQIDMTFVGGKPVYAREGVQ
jgi:predicted amidohydrolase YtcJ